MAYEVITHGGGDGLVYTFNAIAAIFKGPRSLGSSLVYIGGSFATAMMVMTLVIKQELVPSVKWFVGSLLLMTTLMLPKVDIIIKDRITNLQRPIAHVPFMLGAFAGIASQLGDVLAQKMDTVFSTVGGDVMHYRSHGVAMASQLVAKTLEARITDPEAGANIHAFVQQCVVFDIARGKYTIQELMKTPDVWTFFKEKASPIRGFPYKDPKKGTKILTCREAATLDQDSWKKHVNQAANHYGASFYPHTRGNKTASELLSHLDISYQYLTGLSVDASLMLRQNMMRNAIKDGLLELNQVHDSSAAVTAYAVARAQSQQKTAYALQGSMASLALSTLKIVVEVLFYGMFPLVVAIAIFPGGVQILTKYLIALFWIQSWAPMYSILNMLVNVYGRSKSLAILGKQQALTLSMIPRLGEANEWVSAVAGYAMMSVPFLSYGIIHYGAGALSQLATHFGSITQSSASHAAEEATTGNYNLGNTSFDNHNQSNVSAFKYDTNSSVATGKSTAQQLDGALVHKMPNNKTVMDRRPTLDDLGVTFSESRGINAGISKMAEQSHRAGMQHISSAQKNLTSALNKYQALGKQHREGKDLNKSFTHGESVNKDSALSQLSAASEELVKATGYDKSVTNQIVAGIGVAAKAQVGFGGEKSGASLSIEGSARYNNDHSWRDSKTQKATEAITKKYDLQKLVKKAEHEAQEQRYTISNSEGKTADEGINASLNEAFSKLDLAQASFAQEAAYREAAQFSQTQGAESSQNVSPEIFAEQKEKLGLEGALEKLSTPEGLRAVSAGFISQHKPALEKHFEGQSVYKTPEELEAQHQRDKTKIAESQAAEDFYKKNSDAIQEQALESGLKTPIVSDLPERTDQSLKNAEQRIQDQQAIFDQDEAKMQESPKKLQQKNDQPPEQSYATKTLLKKVGKNPYSEGQDHE